LEPHSVAAFDALKVMQSRGEVAVKVLTVSWFLRWLAQGVAVAGETVPLRE